MNGHGTPQWLAALLRCWVPRWIRITIIKKRFTCLASVINHFDFFFIVVDSVVFIFVAIPSRWFSQTEHSSSSSRILSLSIFIRWRRKVFDIGTRIEKSIGCHRTRKWTRCRRLLSWSLLKDILLVIRRRRCTSSRLMPTLVLALGQWDVTSYRMRQSFGWRVVKNVKSILSRARSSGLFVQHIFSVKRWDFSFDIRLGFNMMIIFLLRK